MPEATVDEDGEALPREDNVRTTATAERCEVDPIAESGGVQQSADCKFG